MTEALNIEHKIGRPPVEEKRIPKPFKVLTSEWKQINDNAEKLHYKSASEYIRDTTLNAPKWLTAKCFQAILTKPFKQIIFEKSNNERVTINTETDKFIITHTVADIERAIIEMNSKEDIAAHLIRSCYEPEMLIIRNCR